MVTLQIETASSWDALALARRAQAETARAFRRRSSSRSSRSSRRGRLQGMASIAAPAVTELPALEPVSLHGRRNADTRVGGDAAVGSREDRVQVELGDGG